jgi:hypothetical protein
MYTALKIFILVLLPTLSWAATYYADPSGSGTTCSDVSPCTFEYTVETKASSGDTVICKDGTYSVASIEVPEGVSITAENQTTPPSAKIVASTNLSTSSELIKLQSTSGGNGNQTISYLEFDCKDTYNAEVAIRLKSRDNVTIEYNKIHGCSGSNGSVAIDVSSHDPDSADYWYEFMPQEVGADGNDTTFDNLWASKSLVNPVTGLEIANNDIDDCGYWDGSTDARHGAIELFYVADSTIHDNDINSVLSQGECVTGGGRGKTALLDNVDIYNNTLTTANAYTSESDWTLELWVMKGGCQFYNNTANSGFSLTYGKNTSVYSNTLTSMPTGLKDIGIEFIGQSHSQIYSNTVQGGRTGIIWGTAKNGQGYTAKYATIRNNKIYGSYLYGISIQAEAAASGTNTSEYVDVIFNTIDDEDSDPHWAGIRVESDEGEGGTAILDNMIIKNNIISNLTVPAIKTSGSGTVSNATCDTNQFYNNSTDGWDGGTCTDTDTTDPLYEERHISGGYTPTGASNAIDGGDIIASVYYGSVPSYNGSAPDIGAVETGGADLQAPVISSPDPYDGEILDAGTTSYNFTVSVSDATAVSGCRMSDSDESYADMSDDDTMADNGDGTWDNNLTGLTNGASYTKYIACTDGTTAHTASNNFTSGFAVAPGQGGDIICDNTDMCYGESGANWVNSTAASGYYGTNYRTNASSTQTATWTMQVPAAGVYEVFMIWAAAENRPASTTITVTHAGGTADVPIDQRSNGGQWYSLGSWSFNTGGATVVMTVPLTGYVCADAVKFEAAQQGAGGGTAGAGSSIGGGAGFIKGR